MAHIETITGFERKVRRHFKKVFAQLGDDFFIREPLDDALKVAPCIVEGPCNSWVFIGSHSQVPSLEDVKILRRFNELLLARNCAPVQYLAVVENLDSNHCHLPDYVHVISQADFYANGEQIIIENLVELSAEHFASIKKKLFPESVIPTQCSTRKQHLVSDNSARLLPFFLDYDQELATRLDIMESVDPDEEQQDEFSVRLINGVAGSGKTLILINRAILYCKKYPEKKVRLIIHNNPVVEDIKLKFKTWLGGEPANLEIQTFHSFAWQQYRAKFRYVSALFKEQDVEAAKKKILTDANTCYKELSLKDSQIWDELEYINDYLIKDKDEYLEYDRQGRGFALQKSQREHVWQLYEILVEKLSDPKGYLPHIYIKELALSTKTLPSFDHFMIDEAQFFSPSWLEVIKRSLVPGGSIFMCADPNQGFLKRRLSWKSVGLNVRGRTKRLNHSYRTTYEIMTAANALLEELDVSPEDYVKPDFEKMARGSKPHIIYSRSPQDENARFLNEIEALVKSQEVPLHQIMVVCSRHYNPWSLKKEIESRTGYNTVVNYNDKKDLETALGSRIKIMTVNSCTGMEASTTFVLGAGHIINQAKHIDFTESEREEALQESLRKLYVAMTRAGQKLVVFSTEVFPDSVIPHVECSGELSMT
ncbi:TPA: DNA helicase [Vibrio vulnificus]|uniref:3'-5' exonuclease n=1 Tax=Vibrio vulnificus TaxID=672 RepID=UPI00165D9BD5|nr:3'-5' exonuclease [Vibrio vulnificus]EHI9239022.1 DEAD/DEAH box helicase family protein [Vibrio vulnificus]MCG9651559.1 DEAD/DEAH box helicase family protein [Vibrio vulnificus]MDS1839317.1 3'-5' exonuclease [Vibrio vulnificus]MDS1847938.1 3'-5' exonuclease [Vibrio vulnificus]HAS6308325.1 DNA helicase [Vibrio vulnificus]